MHSPKAEEEYYYYYSITTVAVIYMNCYLFSLHRLIHSLVLQGCIWGREGRVYGLWQMVDP